MNRSLSVLEKHELMNRTKGMSDEELQHVLKFIPTTMLLAELARREGIIIDELVNVCRLFEAYTSEKSIDEMDIIEKEDFVKRLRKAMSIYEIYE